MDMHPPTDEELDGPNQLPQVILTSDLEWNPSSIDFEYDPTSWFSQIDDLPNVEQPSKFDDYGEYVSDSSIATLCTYIENKYDLESYILTNCCELINNYTVEARDVTSTPTDYTKYQAQFGWLSIETIKNTFKHTTQFYRRPMSTLLKKQYKSPYPACNVHWRNEPIATDTVFSSTPEIYGGARMAQLFVGTSSLVSDIYGIKNESQFVQTLQDVIRDRGAPTKLISDHAQVEISNKAKDIVCHLHIQDWQSEAHYQH